MGGCDRAPLGHCGGDLVDDLAGPRGLHAEYGGYLQREIEVLKEQQVQIREQIIGSEAEISALGRQSQLIEKELVDPALDAGLPQLPQGLDLRRLQRGATPDHRPHDPGTVRRSAHGLHL